MIQIDYKDRRPIYLQLMDSIEDLAAKGILTADSQLPSVRSLAMELCINPNTIQRAYAELEKKGIIYSVSGKGSFITKDQESILQDKREELYSNLSSLIGQAYRLAIPEKDILAKCSYYYSTLEKGEAQ